MYNAHHNSVTLPFNKKQKVSSLYPARSLDCGIKGHPLTPNKGRLYLCVQKIYKQKAPDIYNIVT